MYYIKFELDELASVYEEGNDFPEFVASISECLLFIEKHTLDPNIEKKYVVEHHYKVLWNVVNVETNEVEYNDTHTNCEAYIIAKLKNLIK